MLRALRARLQDRGYAAHTATRRARGPTSDTRSAAMLSPHSSQLPHTSMQSLHALTSPLSSVLQRSSTYVETDRVGSRTQNSCHFYGFTQLVLHFYRFTRILCTCTLLPFYAKTCSLLPYLHPMPQHHTWCVRTPQRDQCPVTSEQWRHSVSASPECHINDTLIFVYS